MDQRPLETVVSSEKAVRPFDPTSTILMTRTPDAVPVSVGVFEAAVSELASKEAVGTVRPVMTFDVAGVVPVSDARTFSTTDASALKACRSPTMADICAAVSVEAEADNGNVITATNTNEQVTMNVRIPLCIGDVKCCY